MAQPKITVSQVETTEIAPIASPAFTGTPTAPTPPALDSTTNIATTAFVQGELAGGVTSAAAWVNFNGTGVVAINDSFNVTSITDNGTGDYTVNYTSALRTYPAVAGLTSDTVGFGCYTDLVSSTSTASRIQCYTVAGGNFIRDADPGCVIAY